MLINEFTYRSDEYIVKMNFGRIMTVVETEEPYSYAYRTLRHLKALLPKLTADDHSDIFSFRLNSNDYSRLTANTSHKDVPRTDFYQSNRVEDFLNIIGTLGLSTNPNHQTLYQLLTSYLRRLTRNNFTGFVANPSPTGPRYLCSFLKATTGTKEKIGSRPLHTSSNLPVCCYRVLSIAAVVYEIYNNLRRNGFEHGIHPLSILYTIHNPQDFLTQSESDFETFAGFLRDCHAFLAETAFDQYCNGLFPQSLQFCIITPRQDVIRDIMKVFIPYCEKVYREDRTNYGKCVTNFYKQRQQPDGRDPMFSYQTEQVRRVENGLLLRDVIPSREGIAGSCLEVYLNYRERMNTLALKPLNKKTVTPCPDTVEL